jgi:hypothetical protein
MTFTVKQGMVNGNDEFIKPAPYVTVIAASPQDAQYCNTVPSKDLFR